MSMLSALVSLTLAATPPSDWSPLLAPSAEPAFASVHYINMDRDTDRREHMESMIHSAGLQAERFVAIVPSDAELAAARREFGDGGLTDHEFRATVGGRASHVQVMRHLLATGHPGERYLVMEDDAVLPAGFGGAMAHEALAAAPSGWDVLRLSCRLEGRGFCEPCMSNVSFTSQHGYVDGVVRTRDRAVRTCDRQAQPNCDYVAGGAHAVVYRYESLPKVIAGMSREHLIIDVALALPSDESLASYCVQMPLVGTNNDLGSTRCESDCETESKD